MELEFAHSRIYPGGTGILALLILNIAGRTYRLAQRNNLNLQVKSLDELTPGAGDVAGHAVVLQLSGRRSSHFGNDPRG